jgi:catechol 2,3-dioxygenase-like lactoylglutathione lyase family enzyme
VRQAKREVAASLHFVPLALMRIARPTTDVGRIRRFYEEVLELTVLWSFADHHGFDGVIFGVPDERSQLELVQAPHGVTPSPTVEDALVLYFADPSAMADVAARLRAAHTPEVPSDDHELNPYWPRSGATTFVDPDGYRLIIATS